MLIGLQHSVDQAVVNRISNLITDLRPGDEVTITLDSDADKERAPILKVLSEHGFQVQEQGEKEGEVYIQARRMYH
jgi:hypothetical protein